MARKKIDREVKVILLDHSFGHFLAPELLNLSGHIDWNIICLLCDLFLEYFLSLFVHNHVFFSVPKTLASRI